MDPARGFSPEQKKNDFLESYKCSARRQVSRRSVFFFFFSSRGGLRACAREQGTSSLKAASPLVRQRAPWFLRRETFRCTPSRSIPARLWCFRAKLCFRRTTDTARIRKPYVAHAIPFPFSFFVLPTWIVRAFAISLLYYSSRKVRFQHLFAHVLYRRS